MPDLKNTGESFSRLSTSSEQSGAKQPTGNPRGSKTSAGHSLISSSLRQGSEGPYLVDVMGGEGGLQSLRVKPAVFLKLLDRLEHPLVAHHKRRFGSHSYFAYCGGFIIETSSPRPLVFPGPSRRFEKPPMPREVADRYPGRGISRTARPAETRGSEQKKRRVTEFYTDDNYYVTEWWNTPEDPALSVARLRIEPGVATRPYRLRGVTERYLFLSGHALVEVDGTNREVGPGDGMLIKAGSWRCITNMGVRDLGLLSICRPRFERMNYKSPED